MRRPKGSYSLPRSKILRGKKHFNRLFQNGTDLYGQHLNLKFIILSDEHNPEVRMAFIVAKRFGKAVDRNRTKRLLREGYRLNQYLLDGFPEAGLTFHGAFMARQISLTFREVERDVIMLLQRVSQKITSH